MVNSLGGHLLRRKPVVFSSPRPLSFPSSVLHSLMRARHLRCTARNVKTDRPSSWVPSPARLRRLRLLSILATVALTCVLQKQHAKLAGFHGMLRGSHMKQCSSTTKHNIAQENNIEAIRAKQACKRCKLKASKVTIRSNVDSMSQAVVRTSQCTVPHLLARFVHGGSQGYPIVSTQLALTTNHSLSGSNVITI